MQIVGIHSAGHDTGVSLWEDGALLYSVETERLTRQRHDSAVAHALAALEAHPLFDIDRVGLVASCTGFRQAILQIDDHERVREAIAGRTLHVETFCHLFGKRLPVVVVAHEASHAALSLHYADPADKTLILVNEGRGSFSRNAVFEATAGRLALREVDPLPWYAGGFGWSAIGELIGLGRGPSVAGKTMALGGFAAPDQRLMDALLNIATDLDRLDDGDRLRERQKLIDSADVSTFDSRAGLISSFQSLFTRSVVELLSRGVAAEGYDAVAIGGGCGLNIVANSAARHAIGARSPSPAPNDAGQAIGAAIYAMQFVLGIAPQPFSVYSVGEADTPQDVRSTLAARDISWTEYRADTVAERLADGAVVAFAQGKAECGPRALGHRSILADPTRKGMKKRVSEDIKGREWFRPLAPVMREETLRRVRPDAAMSPYMLYNYDVAELDLTAASHVDGTARIQTVARDANPMLHDLLGRFEAGSGGIGLVNTSLNAGGRPIAQTTADILDDFWARDIDLFVFGDVMVDRVPGHVLQ